MKKNLIRFVGFFAGLSVFLAATLGIVTFAVPDQFASSYQRALVYQYDYYKTLGQNKVVFIGNSSLSFGFDLDLMEERTGRPCAILGNHAGLGLPYLLNMSKSNLQQGDIVVIEYSNADTIGSELLLTGLGNRLDMYRFINPQDWDDIVRSYGTYFTKKLNYWQTGGYHAEGAYSADAYDKRGNMSIYRGECTIPYPFTDEVARDYSWMNFYTDYDLDFIRVLNQYVASCKSIGAEVYFTRNCYLDESVKSTEEEILASDRALAELLDAPLMSNTLDYIFGREYMYDRIQHCNTAGARKRTEQLFQDLCRYVDFGQDSNSETAFRNPK